MTLPISERGYARPDALVSTAWVAEHLDDPAVRLLESDEDLLLYDVGHIAGAGKLDWIDDLNDPVLRDYVGREAMERLLRGKGINADTLVVLYGDRNNWWATYAFWVLRLFGVERLAIMDGGRQRWADEGRPLVAARPVVVSGHLTVGERKEAPLRVFRDEVLAHVKAGRRLVDVRSPEEFRGERLHMPDYPNEGALRGGHIPGARNVPWARAVDPETHCFKTAEELRAIYEREQGLSPNEEVIVYCRIGERSSHTWFALTYLLGYPAVRNYDGSWTEWGNTVRAPIERP
ncbi:MAG: sulfurtransferase [Gemmatimonadales bacterium]|nr:sulfurtransferase [Gemmatimonadales bacterium]